MTDAIWCGVEEPIRSNDMFLATDASGSAQLATFTIEGLNRYSFVWTRSQPISFDVCETLLGCEHEYRSVVVGWRHDIAGIYKIRSLGIERVLTAAGWVTHAEQELGIGYKTFRRLEGEIWPAVPSVSFGWFIMVGRALSLTQMLGNAFIPTIRSFCRSSKLEPSHVFLAALVSEGVTIAYPAQGPSDMHGLIVLSPLVIGTHVESLRASGIISSIRRNENAASVWLCPERNAVGGN